MQLHYPKSLQCNTFLVPVQLSLTVDTTTATSISLSWTSAGSEMDSYEVMWTSDECTDDVDEGSATITETSYIIEGLREGTGYTITVSATNSAGTSPSDPVTGETQEIGTILMCVQCIVKIHCPLCISLPAPSAAPTSVRTSSDSSSSITVQWGMVPCIHHNGDITGYSVQYGVVGSGNTQTMSVSGGDTSHTTIIGLRPARIYSVQVAAVNSADVGLYSAPIYQPTSGKQM